ncbi:g7984 [Coccomyxa viridis]|uniref:G7984 protein n=1 Tax=Coccomyxa viridis TaxID=1274662 RepID=A0ABP1G1Q4_9CHLO
MRSVAVLCWLAVCGILGTVDALKCKDASGKDVSWWTALKAPKGYIYGYIEAKQRQDGFQYNSDLDISGISESHLAETLQQLYSGSNIGYVIWNDQPETKSKVRPKTLHAHAKGVLAFDADGGFYLLHSTPNFPDDPAAGNGYKGINNCTASGKTCGPTHGQLQDGQSYLCVSFDPGNLDAVAEVLRGDELTIYASDVAGLDGQYPNVQQLIKANHRGIAKKTFGQDVQAVDGEPFKLFGMSPTPKNQPVFLYEQIIEPTLGYGLLVQSFTQDGRFPTYCPGGTQPDPEYHFTVDKYSTVNVEEITINQDLSWYCAGNKQQDHSKWAVTIPDSSDAASTSRKLLQNATLARASEDLSKVFCMADINRAGSQAVRGGGALCFTSNPGVWQAFYNTVTQEEKCDKSAQ